MGYILGIDQGRTHTRAAVSDRYGNIISVGHSFGACHAYEGLDRAMQAVRESSEWALKEAKVSSDQLDFLMAGMTGADWPEEYEILRNGLQKLDFCPVDLCVVNDAIIALRGGTSRPYGVVLIAGTGGNCAVRSPGGEEFIYHYFCEPDLQGGIAIGTRTLIAIFRSYTGREEKTLLTQMALKHYALESVDTLCKLYFAGQLVSVSDMTPLVFEAADLGDTIAKGILCSFGIGYAEMAMAALRRMEMMDMPVEVVLSGSIFKGKGTLLIDTIRSEIHTIAPRVSLVNARYEPLVGAVMLGLEKIGSIVQGSIMRNLEQSAKRFGLERLA